MTNTNNPGERYFLPKGYCINPVATTHDNERENEYWNANRWRNALYYQYPVYQFCADLIGQRGIKRVIDVGCGVGRKLEVLHRRFPELEIIGIDQKHPIQICQKRYSFGRWIIDDLEKPRSDISGLQAKLVICSDVIEHLLDPDMLLEYLRNLCSSDGHIVLSTPDRAYLYGASKMESGQRDHVREWTANEFADYLTSRDFLLEEQFHVPPVPRGMNTLWLKEWIYKVVIGRGSYRHNQVCVLLPAQQ